MKPEDRIADAGSAFDQIAEAIDRIRADETGPIADAYAAVARLARMMAEKLDREA